MFAYTNRERFSDSEIARFWQKVVKTDGCWRWTGAKNEHGYGLMCIRKKMVKAHRFSYWLHYGAWPGGLFVCHSCDTPECCNPEHLFLGTQKDNIKDMAQKGRAAWEQAGWIDEHRRRVPRGDNHPMRLHPELRATGDRHRSKTHPESLPWKESHYFRQHPEAFIRGERHANAKLTDAQVLEIRQRYEQGGTSCARLARAYGVSSSLIHLVVTGKRRS